MRSFLQSTAGGTFFQKSLWTFVVRKDVVEVVIKLRRGSYAVVCIVPLGRSKICMFCSWDTYFRRLFDGAEYDVVEGLRKDCPKLFELATTEGGYGLLSFPSADGGKVGGIGMDYDFTLDEDFVASVVSKENLSRAYALLKYNLSIYREIYDHCPYEEWRKGLAEVCG